MLGSVPLASELSPGNWYGYFLILKVNVIVIRAIENLGINKATYVFGQDLEGLGGTTARVPDILETRKLSQQA